MENEKYILQELKEISPSLVQIEKTNVYSVSSYYFDRLSLEIMNKVNAGTEPVYYFSDATPFTVPEGYFENLPKKILERALREQENSDEIFDEMEEISPLLNTISKKPVFSVPNGYFENLETVRPFTSKPEAKVVLMTTTRQKFFGYMVAAVITALMAIGIFLLTGKTGDPLQANGNRIEEVNNLSEQEIMEFLKTNSTPDEVNAASFNSISNEHELENSLKEMSDKEIQQFLKENEVPDEI